MGSAASSTNADNKRDEVYEVADEKLASQKSTQNFLQGSTATQPLGTHGHSGRSLFADPSTTQRYKQNTSRIGKYETRQQHLTISSTFGTAQLPEQVKHPIVAFRSVRDVKASYNSRSHGTTNPQNSGQTIFRIYSGDIKQFKADILVTPICGSSKNIWECGFLCSSVFKAGQPHLLEAYTATPGVHEEIGIVTNSYGELAYNFDRIFFIHIRDFSDSQSVKCIADLHARIRWCLGRARDLKFSSIAFPTLGCGLLKYPPKCVMDSFRKAFDNSGEGLEISIVAMNLQTCKTFVEYFSKDHQESIDRQKQLQQTHSISESDDSSREQDRTCMPTPSTKSAAQTTPVSPAVHKSETQLGWKSSRRVSTELPTVLTTTSRLQGSVFNQLKSDMDGISEKMNKIFVKSSNSEADDQDEKTGTGQPSEVKTSTADILLMSPDAVKVVCPRMPTNHKLYDSLVKLVQVTWRKNLIGLGRDALGLNHTGIEVLRIKIVQNPLKYSHYQHERQDLLSEKLGDDFILQTSSLPDTVTKAESILQDQLNLGINEVYLLHGTTADVKYGIIQDGLDGRLSNQGLFGQGIYFTDSSTKADQYTDISREEDENNSSALRVTSNRATFGTKHYMFICRVLLGRAYVCTEPKKFRRAPCSGASCFSDKCSKHRPLHSSVIGTHTFVSGRSGPTRALLFREFVVYDGRQCYPEFLVKYKRV